MNIAAFRKTRGWNQGQLGDTIGEHTGKPWSRQTVSQAEGGMRTFTPAELVMLADVLDTPLTAFLLPPPRVVREQVFVELPYGVLPFDRYMRLVFGEKAPKVKASAARESLATASEELQRAVTELRAAVEEFRETETEEE